MQAGTLYLVPTPIGNLEDMTYRAVRTLQEVDLICAEDTRQTVKLLNHFEITTKMISLHEHNERTRSEQLLADLYDGKNLALVSDAGTPLVSDPGEWFVQKCIEEGITVIPLPGANAAVTTWIASGFEGGRFYFHGFLPRKKKEIEEVQQSLEAITVPMIFYESPHRMKQTLERLQVVWGDRQIVIGREVTKRYESFYRGTITELIDLDHEWRGELCFIVEGGTGNGQEEAWWQTYSVQEHIQYYEEQGDDHKKALKQCAKDRGLSRNEIYKAFHELQQ
ncbi:16S rRNA (cytidine(1402)-2'-O)-methyltransferase [Geomicrobium sp. JCM 19038]|uniref:16S rRNA (cytidine(1402)-2'-O)-methyltransferase n=1 Tax=Geomicrobium sp. JCM 19038 TaxID=1460635 RepID=UPI00045F1EF6|nr:16S rRNA (cytidine(1402)-2'-O)-methyltransferase [Geomicrobium sp. JCM 19038]GAK09966.1 rRNA small subunit methyltransferase I [Geomicrobium sp. JCM 19038]